MPLREDSPQNLGPAFCKGGVGELGDAAWLVELIELRGTGVGIVEEVGEDHVAIHTTGNCNGGNLCPAVFIAGAGNLADTALPIDEYVGGFTGFCFIKRYCWSAVY